MNPELDLDNLDLKEEVVEETNPAETPEVKEKPNIATEAKEMAVQVIGQNVFDRDLEQALLKVVDEHFSECAENPNYNSNVFRIPDLNTKIWEAFHNYENFVYANKFENIDLNEIAKILREQVVPKITRNLWDLSSQQSL